MLSTLVRVIVDIRSLINRVRSSTHPPRRMPPEHADRFTMGGRIPVLDVVASHDGIVDLYRRRGWREVGIAHPPWLPESPLTLMVLDDR